jgi:hypothetical protein
MKRMLRITERKRALWARILFTAGLFICLCGLPEITQAQWATSGNNIYNTNTGNVGNSGKICATE